jgi:Ca-activated chloride channel family protein
MDSSNGMTIGCYRCGLHKPKSMTIFRMLINKRMFMSCEFIRTRSPAGGALEVLLRVQAPDRPADLAHLPKRLALVVDRSGSMKGQPLQEALRCVTHIASHLTPQDALALVVCDDKVDTLLPLHPMRSDDVVAKAVAGVQAGGMTDLHGGWLAGAQQLEGGTEQTASRVNLLSDGQANHGKTGVRPLRRSAVSGRAGA